MLESKGPSELMMKFNFMVEPVRNAGTPGRPGCGIARFGYASRERIHGG